MMQFTYFEVFALGFILLTLWELSMRVLTRVQHARYLRAMLRYAKQAAEDQREAQAAQPDDMN